MVPAFAEPDIYLATQRSEQIKSETEAKVQAL